MSKLLRGVKGGGVDPNPPPKYAPEAALNQ